MITLHALNLHALTTSKWKLCRALENFRVSSNLVLPKFVAQHQMVVVALVLVTFHAQALLALITNTHAHKHIRMSLGLQKALTIAVRQTKTRMAFISMATLTCLPEVTLARETQLHAPTVLALTTLNPKLRAQKHIRLLGNGPPVSRINVACMQLMHSVLMEFGAPALLALIFPPPHKSSPWAEMV
jgi:hypothetical protein